MNRPKITRWLRVTWTVFWGTLAVLLVALWVRSYWWQDTIGYHGVFATRSLVSHSGWVYAGELYSPQVRGWKFGSQPVTDTFDLRRQFAVAFFDERPRFVCAACPHWLILLTIGSATVAPWLTWRFRVRTLLAITAFVASILGLIAWASI